MRINRLLISLTTAITLLSGFASGAELLSGVAAFASHSPFGDRSAAFTVDGSNLNTPEDPNDPSAWTHLGGNNQFGQGDVNWLTDARAGQTGIDEKWIAFDLGSALELDAMNVFNFGVSEGARNTRGVDEADIYYRSDSLGNNENENNLAFDPDGWTSLGTENFTIGPVGEEQEPDTISLDISARFIAIDVNTSHGDASFVGLGEVQFFAAAGALPDPGDFNNDGNIDFNDFVILSNNIFGHLDGISGFDKGDMNRDGKIDLGDFHEFVAAFNGGAAAAQPVPEPSGIFMALPLLMLLGVRRQRRA